MGGGGELRRTTTKNTKKQQELFQMGEDHVLNVNLRVMLVFPFIFTDI